MLGSWTNYEHLEESLTIDELIETFDIISENRVKEMEFLAKLNGAEVKSSGSSSPQTESNSLAERLRSKMNKEKEDLAISGNKTSFSDGVGYQVIG